MHNHSLTWKLTRSTRMTKEIARLCTPGSKRVVMKVLKKRARRIIDLANIQSGVYNE